MSTHRERGFIGTQIIIWHVEIRSMTLGYEVSIDTIYMRACLHKVYQSNLNEPIPLDLVTRWQLGQKSKLWIMISSYWSLCVKEFLGFSWKGLSGLYLHGSIWENKKLGDWLGSNAERCSICGRGRGRGRNAGKIWKERELKKPTWNF